MRDRQTEMTLASVPEKAIQAGEVCAGWTWTEPGVWTERMLTALERGLKGDVWFSLIDKVYAQRNLEASFARVKQRGGGAGIDHGTIEHFERRLEANLAQLHRALKDGTYRPQAVRRCWIPKPGSKEKRPLGVPTVRDRVVQTALRNVLEPIFEREFAEHSYGFRPGRGCKDALRRVTHLLDERYHYVVDADLKSYFDTIPHEQLMKRIETRIADGRVLELVRAFLDQDVMDGLQRWTPKGGTPQGAVISPLLSSIYLDPLDHLMVKRGYEMVRYADDFVILCRSAKQANKALAVVRQWVEDTGLYLHPDKTRIVDAAQRGGHDFLGYHFECGYRWPSKRSLKNLRAAVRGKTKRTNGHSLECIIGELNPILRGWFEYFKHSHSTHFPVIDGWVRMRLRSILRKRHGGQGRGRGDDHYCWPNCYFIERGLFTLELAHARPRQSRHGG